MKGLGLAAGWLLDRWLGDPRRGHPVAGFGTVAGALEERTYADRRAAGALHVTLLVGGTTALGLALSRLARDRPWAHVIITAAATWTVLGGRSLEREAMIIGDHLLAGRIEAARDRLPHLVGRDPSESPSEIARAVVESVAENTSDAVVAPLVWGAAAGVPGLLTYRAINTLDAMIGHRSARYERFGFVAARLDDLANWVPARLTAALTVVLAPLVDGSPAAAWRAAPDAVRHPSPNAGPVEACFAGALGITLGGRNTYQGTESDRGTLGSGPPPTASDIARSVRLSRAIGVAATGLLVGGTMIRSRVRAGQRSRSSGPH
ncbi:cobalamin biosynthesis protein [Propionibacteriaceae bacterium Y1685]|uniref:cobalamin biosynthesis protein n=1 Tax=Microlunatus sp. Y1700 TaxID=3418487 RepID=UPI003B7C70F6